MSKVNTATLLDAKPCQGYNNKNNNKKIYTYNPTVDITRGMNQGWLAHTKPYSRGADARVTPSRVAVAHGGGGGGGVVCGGCGVVGRASLSPPK